jgi:nitrate/nitrite transporter NarK
MLSAPIALVLVRSIGWRLSFVVFGVFGAAWAAAWFAWYRDSPSEHRDVNAAELALIEERQPGDRFASAHATDSGTPWRALLRSSNLYAICAMYFTYGYGLYFYFTWLPTYLIDVLGFSLVGAGALSALPFLLAGIANLAGGWTTDFLARSRGLRVARCGLGSGSFLTCSLLVLASTMVGNATAKAVLLAAALGAVDFALSACWAVCLDIGHEHAGVVTGAMNTIGNLGGMLTPLVVGVAVQQWHSWTIPFYVTAGVYAAGACAWLTIDPLRKLHA